MRTLFATPVATAGLLQRELWKPAGLNQFEVLPNRAFDRPIDLDPSITQLVKRTPADPANDNGVDGLSSKGGYRLALAMDVLPILIGNTFANAATCIHDNEVPG